MKTREDRLIRHVHDGEEYYTDPLVYTYPLIRKKMQEKYGEDTKLFEDFDTEFLKIESQGKVVAVIDLNKLWESIQNNNNIELNDYIATPSTIENK